MLLRLKRLLCLCVLCLPTLARAEDDPPAADVPAGEWVVQVAPGYTVADIAAGLGAQVIGPVASLTDTYILRLPAPAAARLAAAPDPARVEGVLQAVPQPLLYPELFALPVDPLFPSQWHLRNTGQSGGTPGEDVRAVAAWNAGYTGRGVALAVVDEGVEYTHPDLAPHYAPALSQDFSGALPDPDPMPALPGQGHGTAVAGLAAAAADGVACGVGVAYEATLSAIRFGIPTTDSRIATFLSFARADNAIYTSSWGFAGGSTINPGLLPFTLAALAANTTAGRGGAGNIYVFAGGNSAALGENAGRSALLTSRHVIAVAATDSQGRRTFYSEPGSVILVNAPGGTGDMVTTDRVGGAGYTPGDCTGTFTGTSAAVPVVAGSVALLLQAQPALTWRDVQYLLSQSARHNDPADPGWLLNSAGYRFHTAYGYGQVNAAAAARLASGWETVPPAAPVVSSGVLAVGQPVPDNAPASPLTVTATFSDPLNEHLVVEHVEVRVALPHPRHGDIAAVLVSPAGTRLPLMTRRPAAIQTATANYQNTLWLSVAHRGEAALGTWRLELTDNAAGQTGTLTTWELRLYGVPALPQDVPARAAVMGSLDVPYTDSGRALQLSRSPEDPPPSCGRFPAYRSAWYSFTAPAEGRLNVSSAGSAYDTVLSVWQPGQPLRELACQDDN
ncbi:MAG: S8 family serine peptidase, partial [Anaerolineae bacterium]|nr:S8 family serine peptidase [Anaerolineae bacterium]